MRNVILNYSETPLNWTPSEPDRMLGLEVIPVNSGLIGLFL